jgi:YHS domain-containing protein
MKLNRRSFGLLGALAAAAAVTLLPASGLFAKDATPTLCVVTGETIKDVNKAAGSVAYKGKTYNFCCKGCVARFSKADDAGKARYARLTELRLEKAVLQSKLNAVSAELTTLEKAAAAPAAVESKPAAAAAPAAAKTVYCAVTDEKIGTPDQAAGGSSVVNGRTYYFCCPGCKPKFDGEQAKYAARADKAEAARATAK